MNRREALASLGMMAATAAIAYASQDDAAFVQSFVDRGAPVPVGTYHLHRPIDGRGRHLEIHRSTFYCDLDTAGLYGFLLVDARTTGTVSYCFIQGV